MKLFYSIITLSLLALMACSKKEQKVKLDDGIYDKKDMVIILVELHLVEAAFRSGAIDDSTLTKTRIVQQTVLNRLGTDTLQFDESYAYYSQNSDKLEEIYDEVTIELTRRKLNLMDMK